MVGKFSFGQVTITMKKEDGVYIVPCKVNGLGLSFILDTGASNVSISITEALFMIKNGYLHDDDLLGISYAQLANGEITENTRINIDEIEFAGLKLRNIEAIVVHQLNAPLLLGQSAISKLGKIQIDPSKNTLTIFNAPNNTVNNQNIIPNTKDNQNKQKDPILENITWVNQSDSFVVTPPTIITLYTKKYAAKNTGVLKRPEGDSPLLAYVLADEEVQVIGITEGTNKYYKVQYNNVTGFVPVADLH